MIAITWPQIDACGLTFIVGWCGLLVFYGVVRPISRHRRERRERHALAVRGFEPLPVRFPGDGDNAS
jgi:hypothetical protein